MGSDTSCECRKNTPWQAVASGLVAESGVRVTEDQSYGPDPRHCFDIYEPEPDQSAIRSTAMFLYGGGWKSGERGCYRFVGAALARRGIRTIIPDYRLFPNVRYPESLCENTGPVSDACYDSRVMSGGSHEALHRRPGSKPDHSPA